MRDVYFTIDAVKPNPIGEPPEQTQAMEFWIWGVLPAVAALIGWGYSLYFAIRARSAFHILSAGLVSVASLWSLLVLHAIFIKRAWPTILSHLCIGAIIVLVLLQYGWFRLKKRVA